MKKILLSAIITGASLSLFAQMPTMDFESWTTNNNGTIAVPEEPTGWVTENQLVNLLSMGNSTSVFKVTGAEAHGGTYAMKIVTVDVINDPSGGQLPDPSGIAFAGKIIISPLSLKYGFPQTNRPTTCDFWYKYTPVGGDSASCGIVLTKWNGTKRDTIAVGGVVIKTAASAYTLSTFSLTYDPTFSTVIPDSMSLGFSATCLATKTCGVVGSTLWVDDVTFSGNNAVNENPTSEGVILFPNPASDYVTISVGVKDAASTIVYDATGRTVAFSTAFDQANSLTRKSAVINTSNLAPGLYSYSVVAANGAVLRAGKFNVIR